MTEHEIRNRINELKVKLKTYKKLGEYFGVSPMYVNDVIKGRRSAASPKILAKLGIKKVIDYV